MHLSHRVRLSLLAAAFVSSIPSPALACSSCGCTVGTDWADQGYSTAKGLRLELRYDFVDQDQLRRGAHTVDRASVPIPNDDEIQQATITRFYTLNAAYAINRDWAVSASLPYLNRQHSTIAEGDDTLSTSHTSGVGDARILARYQGFFEDRSFGVQFGVKLPTGAYHSNFASGPQAGAQLDRGLQAGSGTTDLLLGLYQYAAISRDWDRFEQIQLKQPLDSRQQFRPSSSVDLTAGLRYVGFAAVTPQLQLNARFEGRETGAQGDYENSGSRVLYLSPGLSGRLYGGVSAYGFVQVPLWQYYNGYQLAPHYNLSAGVSYRF
jgi:hypothetical protein